MKPLGRTFGGPAALPASLPASGQPPSMVARFCPAAPVKQNCVGSGLLHVISATSGARTATRLNGVTGKIRWLVAAIAVTAFALPALAKDIVQTAQDNGNFYTLVVALKEAGLVETLKGKRPFMVFAPTDAAFAKHAIECRQSTMSATLQGLT